MVNLVIKDRSAASTITFCLRHVNRFFFQQRCFSFLHWNKKIDFTILWTLFNKRLETNSSFFNKKVRFAIFPLNLLLTHFTYVKHPIVYELYWKEKNRFILIPNRISFDNFDLFLYFIWNFVNFCISMIRLELNFLEVYIANELRMMLSLVQQSMVSAMLSIWNVHRLLNRSNILPINTFDGVRLWFACCHTTAVSAWDMVILGD